jgi:hypothetical protein
MSGWALLGEVIIVWFVVSVGGAVLVIGAAEISRWRHNRHHRCTVTPLFPQSSHVRVIGKDAS